MSARAVGGVSRLAALVMASSLLMGGCWETPSRSWYDGGADGGDGCDAGCCGAGCCEDSDCGVDAGARPYEWVCDDNDDNDDDGLEDCADADCASHATCCADGGVELIPGDWSAPELDLLWHHLPRASPTSSPARQTEDGVVMLTGWDDAVPHALAFHTCVSLALGATLTFDVIATARDTTCETSPGPCNEYAAMVLTAAHDTAPGQPFFEELAIRVHGDARGIPGRPAISNQAVLRVTQAGVQRGEPLVIDPAVRYRVTLRVAPSVTASRASLQADLELRRVDDLSASPAILSNIFIAMQDDLVRGTTGCQEVGGLYVGVEMVGNQGARLGPVHATSLTCVNPSQFQTSPAGTTTLTSESLGVPESYGGAHVGAPTLGSSFNDASHSVQRWDLFFEATNEATELDDFGVGYALAHARTATFGGLPVDWTTSSTPRLGSDPPSCLGGGTCNEPSVRDPFLLLTRSPDDVLQRFDLVFAEEAATGGHTLRVARDVDKSPNAALGSSTDLMVSDADCVDLRDPAILPVVGGTGGYWLFFTCVRVSEVGEVRAVRLEDDFSLRDGSVQRVITPATVGPLAAQGVSGAEPIVRSHATGLTLQVWAVARDAGGTRSLVLMTGQLSAEDVADGGVSEAPPLETLPELHPYLANPVLRSAAPAFGGCPGICRITGVAVSETAGNHDELRFLVARRVFVNADNVFSELVPLTQIWRSP